VTLVKPISSGVKPLCDTCNRNSYPCHCPRASHEIIIACQDFILAHGINDPVKSQPSCTIDAEKTELTATDRY
jgi:hypothetical protein